MRSGRLKNSREQNSTRSASMLYSGTRRRSRKSNNGSLRMCMDRVVSEIRPAFVGRILVYDEGGRVMNRKREILCAPPSVRQTFFASLRERLQQQSDPPPWIPRN